MFFSTEPKLSLETKISQKADAMVTEGFGPSFLVLSDFKNLAGLLGFTRYFDKYCGKFKIISVTHRRSLKKLLFGKNAILQVKKIN